MEVLIKKESNEVIRTGPEIASRESFCEFKASRNLTPAQYHTSYTHCEKRLSAVRGLSYCS
jgi:hypothetical protein